MASGINVATVVHFGLLSVAARPRTCGFPGNEADYTRRNRTNCSHAIRGDHTVTGPRHAGESVGGFR